MDNFDLINDFVDGQIEPSKEELLFRDLASSEESRRQMKEVISLKTTFAENREFFLPPAEATLNIFSEVGIVGKGAVAKPVGGFWLKKFARRIVGALGASALTAVVMYLLMNARFDSRTAELEENYKSGLAKAEASYQEQLGQNRIAYSSAGRETIREVPVYKIIYRDRNSSGSGAQFATQDSEDDGAHPADFASANLAPAYYVGESSGQPLMDMNLRGQLSHPGPISASIPNTNAYGDGSSILDGFSVEVRNALSWNLPKETINPKEFSKFNNMAVGIFYGLGRYISLGVEVRQETFYQEFAGYDKRGIYSDFSTQPNYTTIGGAIRASVPEWTYSGFMPIAQASVGGNQVGAVGRVMLGGAYSFSNNWSFVFGPEFSYLYYKFQSNNFGAQRIGLNFGLNYKY